MNATISNRRVRNNIFHQAPPERGGMKTIELGDGLSTSNVEISVNITAGSSMTDRMPPSGTTVSANLLGTDPLLVDPATFGFHLLAMSPAIDAGLTLPEVPTDFDGTPRPQGAAADIGAFELIAGSPGQPPVAPTGLEVR